MSLLNKIYALPIPITIAVVCVGVLIWCLLKYFLSKKLFLIANFFLFVFSVIYILCLTLFLREYGDFYIDFIPFNTVKKAAEQPELYRSLLMNCVLFVPFGLSMAGIMPSSLGVEKRTVIIVFFGLLLSTSVELLQYALSLGNSEIDDVIMNTLGSSIPALLILVQEKIRYKLCAE